MAKKGKSGGGYTVTAADKDAFIDRFADIIHDIAPTVGIAPEIMLAQAGHESRWGRSGLVDRANNYFGIKGKYEGNSVRMRTREVSPKGKSYYTNAPFRAYPTAAHSFQDWGRLLGQSRFDRVRNAKNVQDQIAALNASKYATERFNKKSNYKDRLTPTVEFVQNHPSFQQAHAAWETYANREYPSEAARKAPSAYPQPAPPAGFSSPIDPASIAPRGITIGTFNDVFAESPPVGPPLPQQPVVEQPLPEQPQPIVPGLTMTNFDAIHGNAFGPPTGLNNLSFPSPLDQIGDFNGYGGDDVLIGGDEPTIPRGLADMNIGGSIDARLHPTAPLTREELQKSLLFSEEEEGYNPRYNELGMVPNVHASPNTTFYGPHDYPADTVPFDNEPLSPISFQTPDYDLEPSINPYGFGDTTVAMAGPASVASYGPTDFAEPPEVSMAYAPDTGNLIDYGITPQPQGYWGTGLELTRPELPDVSPTQFGSAMTAPMVGPASMAYGFDISGEPNVYTGGYTPPTPPSYLDPVTQPQSKDVGWFSGARAQGEFGGKQFSSISPGVFDYTGPIGGWQETMPSERQPERAPPPVDRFIDKVVERTVMRPETYTYERQEPIPGRAEKGYAQPRNMTAVEDMTGLTRDKTAFGPTLGDFAFGFGGKLMSEMQNPFTSDIKAQAKAASQPPQAQPKTRTVTETRTRQVPTKITETQRVPNPAYSAPRQAPRMSAPLPQPMNRLSISPQAWGFDAFSAAPSAPMPSVSQSFQLAGNSLLGGLTDAMLSGLGYGPDSSFTGGWGMGWGDGGPGGYSGGSVYDGNSGPYGGGDARFDGGWGGISDGDTYR